MTVVDDITQALVEADALVEATVSQTGPRRYALEAGMRICAIPAVRATRIDSAELIGFIHNKTTRRPDSDYDEIAALIVDQFDLGKES